MGNSPSNKYCPKKAAEDRELISSAPSSQIVDSDNLSNELVCNSHGCLGSFFIAYIKRPSPPSLLKDSLNLIGVTSRIPPTNQVIYSSRDWVACRDFIVDKIMENYKKNTIETDYEQLKTYLSHHIDNFGWVETNYQSAELLRGEIMAPNNFSIDLFIDNPDLRQCLTSKLGPFDISDNGNSVISALGTALNDYTLIDVSILNDIFLNQESINEIISHGYISGILGDPPVYFKISVEYLS